MLSFMLIPPLPRPPRRYEALKAANAGSAPVGSLVAAKSDLPADRQV